MITETNLRLKQKMKEIHWYKKELSKSQMRVKELEGAIDIVLNVFAFNPLVLPNVLTMLENARKDG